MPSTAPAAQGLAKGRSEARDLPSPSPETPQRPSACVARHPNDATTSTAFSNGAQTLCPINVATAASAHAKQAANVQVTHSTAHPSVDEAKRVRASHDVESVADPAPTKRHAANATAPVGHIIPSPSTSDMLWDTVSTINPSKANPRAAPSRTRGKAARRGSAPPARSNGSSRIAIDNVAPTTYPNHRGAITNARLPSRYAAPHAATRGSQPWAHANPDAGTIAARKPPRCGAPRPPAALDSFTPHAPSTANRHAHT